LGDRKGGAQQVLKHPVYAPDSGADYKDQKHKSDEKVLIGAIGVHAYQVQHEYS
jgi:hypothetical protein